MIIPTILLAVALSPIGDRCHQLYTNIEREIDREMSSLDVIELCMKPGVSCKDSELEPAVICAFDQNKLSAMLEEMTEYNRHNPSCKSRFSSAINLKVNSLLARSVHVMEMLGK